MRERGQRWSRSIKAKTDVVQWDKRITKNDKIGERAVIRRAEQTGKYNKSV